MRNPLGRIRKLPMTPRRQRRIVLFAMAFLSGVCVGCSTRDVSGEPAFAKVIDDEYRIVGDVDAYGIKKDLNDREAAFVELIPPPGISGPEVVFKKRLTKGQTFRIRSVRRRFALFENGIEYVVDLRDPDLRQGIEVRIALMRGNKSGPAELNSKLYQRLSE